jgi:beta-catenin-like protein 1
VLSLLILNSKENQLQFGQLNGFDHLLVALSAYRKQDPAVIEEEEMAENLFDCLCAALQQPENQELFITAEGIELMLIMVK